VVAETAVEQLSVRKIQAAQRLGGQGVARESAEVPLSVGKSAVGEKAVGFAR
jgi:hypothetical protein